MSEIKFNSIEEIEAKMRTGNKRSEAERKFLAKVRNWTARGARFKLSGEFREYDGWTFTAFMFVACNLSHRSANLSWTLRLPHTATKKSMFRHQASVRFFGAAEGHQNPDEQMCAICASGILETNGRYPVEGRGQDGMRLEEAQEAPAAQAQPVSPTDAELIRCAKQVLPEARELKSIDEVVSAFCAFGVGEISALITADKLPKNIARFEELHDYLDANCLGLAEEFFSAVHTRENDNDGLIADGMHRVIERTQEAIDFWLRERATKLAVEGMQTEKVG